MRPQTGQLERSLEALTIGVHQGARRRSRVLADTHTGEYDQMVQLNVTGLAGNEWAYDDQPVTWELPFLYAPAQRRVPFDRPHFKPGFEVLQPTDVLIHLGAQVVGWNINDSGFFIGATVRVYIVAPLVTEQVSFGAIAHLTFQGYATYAEGSEFDT